MTLFVFALRGGSASEQLGSAVLGFYLIFDLAASIRESRMAVGRIVVTSNGRSISVLHFDDAQQERVFELSEIESVGTNQGGSLSLQLADGSREVIDSRGFCGRGRSRAIEEITKAIAIARSCGESR